MFQVEAEVGEFGKCYPIFDVFRSVFPRYGRPNHNAEATAVAQFFIVLAFWMIPPVLAQDLQGPVSETTRELESKELRNNLEIPEQSSKRPVLEAPRIFETRSMGPFDSILKDDPAEPTKLSHSIYLDSYRGVPSRISLRVSSLQELAKVQLTVISDGVLIVIPMRWVPSTGMFQSVVPTPEVSFEYTFQLTFNSGKTLATQQFSVSDACLKRPTEKLLADSSPEKKELLQELIELDREIAQLGYVVTAIEEIKQKSR